ncbi:hypothetical protein B566_EDAN011035 [Ephemera danica]|nr:hypothetical protein B566_EDAN011035 [Ephemera danica]
MILQLIFLVFALVTPDSVLCWEKEPVVTVLDGQLRGTTMTTLDGNNFHAFLGIPYAEPPVDNRRFKAPGEPAPWEGIRNATEEGSVCAQVPLMGDTFIGSEDCLYLNVYTRQLSETDMELLPVLFWIHGGAFYAGDGGTELNGPEFLMDQEILLVTINYRLGPFGFLSSGNQVVPGNFGMKDSVMAMKWVRDNIDNFGGDNSRVTLHGYSSGSSMVHAHLFSPMSKGLFHAAIMQSGSLSNDCVLQGRPSGVMQVLGALVGCKEPHSSALLHCLRDVPASELALATNSLPSWGVKIPTAWGPVVEWAGRDDIWEEEPFLVEEPEKLIAEGRIPNDVPVISGITKDEGIGFGYFVAQSPDLLRQLENGFGTVARLAFCLKFSDKKYKSIKKFYFGDREIDENERESMIKLYSDALFVWGQVSQSELIASANEQPVYFYQFSFVGRISESMTLNISSEHLGGVGHADDLAYVFRRSVPFPDGKPDTEEYNTIKRMGRIIANFAATGNPTPEVDDLLPERWLPLLRDVQESASNFRYLEISTEPSMVQGRPFSERMEFWGKLTRKRKGKKKSPDTSSKISEEHDEL